MAVLVLLHRPESHADTEYVSAARKLTDRVPWLRLRSHVCYLWVEHAYEA
jgi:hypothetical protein